MIRRFIQSKLQNRSISILSQLWHGPQATAGGVEAEKRLHNLLQSAFPKAHTIQVADISGGCGAMYEILVKAPEFKGLSIVKQHRLVNEALKEEIKEMHGLRISTSAQ
ncbi:bolA-like protein 3 [Neocloeon triangulifer]|uniref:bolA-like protein 3 n=1 Tax=Neocloeon triangulifer TaxID=2078957 RepID=UPI00286EDAF7|nr:bolA-like protein 3 [Neocloeon triangulifer]